MSRTDVHAPFHTTDYDRLAPEPIVFDGQAYHRIDGIDYTEFDNRLREALKHLPRENYEKSVRHHHNRQRRNQDRNVCRKITRDPDFYDEDTAVFADRRADKYAWS